MSLLMDSRKKWSSSTTETNGAFGMQPPGVRSSSPYGRFKKCRSSPLPTLHPRTPEGQSYRRVNVSLGSGGKLWVYNAENIFRRADITRRAYTNYLSIVRGQL